MAKKIEDKSFEKNLEELDGIITKIEQGELPLESMLVEYEKGMVISAQLTQQLEKAKAKLMLLGDGKLKELEMDE
ncbi:MAG: exodeoxyribonuclease VII small subunit [Eubacteriales bacterium]|nr:exodeoxyribonuclease VII small subunit [Eubacteriales bacterium]MDD4105521.1 exodeoxyribonuclease VII small subunit [Eubacteriales bacterium]MDD4710016.1 exodeoxyribonuclease VII small subunit [Eubacteriales bacterium]NLO15931.1 exodeoxyribonuclease VII small subunit [Clostridiales bacterium]